jgi:hypothetical protein
MKKIIFLALTLCVTTAPALFAQDGHAYGQTKKTTVVRTHVRHTGTTTVHTHVRRTGTTGTRNARLHGGKALAKGHYTVHHRHTTTTTRVY